MWIENCLEGSVRERFIFSLLSFLNKNVNHLQKQGSTSSCLVVLFITFFQIRAANRAAFYPVSGTALQTADVSAQESEEGRTSAGCGHWCAWRCSEPGHGHCWGSSHWLDLVTISWVTLGILCYFQVHLINCTLNHRLMSQRLARNELLVLFYLWHCLCRCDFVTLQCHGAILAAGFEGEHPRAQARGSTGGVCVCVQCRCGTQLPLLRQWGRIFTQPCCNKCWVDTAGLWDICFFVGSPLILYFLGHCCCLNCAFSSQRLIWLCS